MSDDEPKELARRVERLSAFCYAIWVLQAILTVILFFLLGKMT